MGFGERKGNDHQNEIGLRLEVARVVPGRMRRCGDHAAGGSIASLTVVGLNHILVCRHHLATYKAFVN
jgi:hypothetical protein